MVTRRAFLVTGVAGSAALVAAYWFHTRSAPRVMAQHGAGADAVTVLGAIAPVMLEGALPEQPDARRAALTATLERVEATIGQLPAASQHELAQLFALLAWPPARLTFTGLGSDWHEASPDAIEEALDGLRGSTFTLKRSAYAALHQLVLGAWYAGTEAWSRTGYPGPPSL